MSGELPTMSARSRGTQQIRSATRAVESWADKRLMPAVGFLTQAWTAVNAARKWRLALFLTTLTVVLCFLRRPDQFLNPYIWVEDGLYVLTEYMNFGYSSIIGPMAGYFVLAIRLLPIIAYKISFLWAPHVELVLMVLFTSGVSVAIALSPTHLRARLFCACATLLVPIGPETFAVLSYVNWWAGLLLFLVVLWDTDRGQEWVRWIYLFFAGLSTPIIVPVTLVLILRAGLDRTSKNLCIAVAGLAISGAQYYAAFYFYEPSASGLASIPGDAKGIFTLIATAGQQFVARFFYADAGLVLGFVISAVLCVIAYVARDRLDRYFYFLLATFICICGMVSLRMQIIDLQGIHPLETAQRYFFFPYVLLAWLVIWLAAASSTYIRLIVACCLLFSVAQAGTSFSLRHDAVDWQANVVACAQADDFDLPIHYNGDAKQMWQTKVTGAMCRQMLRESLLDRFFYQPIHVAEPTSPLPTDLSGTMPFDAANANYTVITHGLLDSSGTRSYLRLFNQGEREATVTATFVGASSGRSYGSTNISVKPFASLQIELLSELSQLGHKNLKSTDDEVSVYLRSTQPSVATQHILYNAERGLLQNLSKCQRSSISDQNLSLINVHTSRVTGYASIIGIHNRSAKPVTVDMNIYEAKTGEMKGRATVSVEPHRTIELLFSDIEKQAGWLPGMPTFHANLILNSAASLMDITFDHWVKNVRTDEIVNLGTFCDVVVESNQNSNGLLQ